MCQSVVTHTPRRVRLFRSEGSECPISSCFSVGLRSPSVLCLNVLTNQFYKQSVPEASPAMSRGSMHPVWMIQDVDQHRVSDPFRQSVPSASFEFETQRCASRCFGCVIQATPEPAVPSAVSQVTEVVTETTSFADEVTGVTIGKPAAFGDADIADAVTSAGLSGFLSRPVRIFSFTYLESDPTGLLATIDPWFEFFNNFNIKYKLHNYAFMRCNLKLKVVINASPFYYGAVRVNYSPLPNFSPNGIVNLATKELIPYSQTPGFFMYPQDSEGGEMTLPFLWPKNFLRVQVAQDFTDMGRLRFHSYAPLRSANGATGVGVSVQVYAWAEDVVLGGPTTGLSMQAQDEYGSGPISRPASTIAKIAGMLTGVPIFGKFATATEMGARAMAGIATLFGYTNVPVIQPSLPFRPNPMPPLASSMIGYPVEKLTFDPKNELAVDPSIVGCGSEDELSIESLVTRQSYLTSTTWTTSTPVDTPLFTTLVSPNMYDFSGSNFYLTPLALVSRLFVYWRGDVIFTFKVVASRYHKGRLRISYDPANGAVQTTGDVGSTVFNTIVDIGAESETEVRIPYQQALAWLKTDVSNSPLRYSTSTTPALTYDDALHNGVLSVKVLTLLTAPEATSSVNVLVFVRAAENFELSYAQNPQYNMSHFAVQAQPERFEPLQELRGEMHLPGTTPDTIVVDRSRIYMGENVRSVRHLLRRTVHLDTQRSTSTIADGMLWMTNPKFPPYYGYDLNGINKARNVGNTADVNFNWTKLTPWHMLAPCFVGQRGSMFWHFNVDAPEPVKRIMVTKMNDQSVTAFGLAVEATPALASGIPKQVWSRWWASSGGSAMTNQLTNGAVSVSTASYNQFKFQSTDPKQCTLVPTSGQDYDGANLETLRVELPVSQAANTIKIERYFGVGTDYNLIFFRNVPTLFQYSAPAAPAA